MLDVTRCCCGCGVDISHRRANAKWCSKRCLDIARGMIRVEPYPEQTCPSCGAQYQGHPTKGYCSRKCRDHTRHERAKQQGYIRPPRPARTCPVCGEQYHPTCGDQLYCSRRCGGVARRQQRGTLRWPASPVYFITCGICSRLVASKRKRKLCGSKECRAEVARRYYQSGYYEQNREQYIARAQRRYAQVKGLEREDIDPLRIYERDKWMCQLCRKKVRRTPRRKHDPLMASLDHIIPVTKGGGWTYANLHTTHLRCNKSKGNRGGGEQLRLVG